MYLDLEKLKAASQDNYTPMKYLPILTIIYAESTTPGFCP